MPPLPGWETCSLYQYIYPEIKVSRFFHKSQFTNAWGKTCEQVFGLESYLFLSTKTWFKFAVIGRGFYCIILCCHSYCIGQGSLYAPAWWEKIGILARSLLGNLSIWREILTFEIKKYIRNSGKSDFLAGKNTFFQAVCPCRPDNAMSPTTHVWPLVSF